jgi:Cellulose binding domain
MVTPTFAAGLGVVVAAALAVGMTTRTVLHFSGPDQQKYCTAHTCAPRRPGGVGTLASAKPGIKLLPATGGSSGAQSSSSSSGGPGRGSGANGPVINYQTTQKWSWGFDGQIMISGIPAGSLDTWRLSFDYPGTRIVEVQGARWEPTGVDSGVAEPEAAPSGASAPGAAGQNMPQASGLDSGGPGPGHSGQRSPVVITIEASGPPGAPSDCHFDNAACSFH